MNTANNLVAIHSSSCAELPTSMDLQEVIVNQDALACLDSQSAIRLKILPVALWAHTNKPVLIVACTPDADVAQRERVAQLIDPRLELHFMPCAEKQLLPAIRHWYAVSYSLQELLHMSAVPIGEQSTIEYFAEYPAQLIDALLMQAARMNSSDLHVSPNQHSVTIRLRIDGVMLTLARVALTILNSLLIRIKIVADLDIAETRLPQDGQFRRVIDGRAFDFRVSTFPTISGENIVVRLIAAQRPMNKLSALNLSPLIMRKLCSLVKKPAGMIVVCGPTGAGKSTTLFALLEQHDNQTLNVMTLEDPVEQRIAGIRQTSIDVTRQWGYAQALRALLRQDPDVLLVGEVRDADSCGIALRAVSTGHQVLTTVHANDAHSAIHRMQALRAGNGALAMGLSGIVAQRLLRCLCSACGGKAVGCSSCIETGYKGRRVVMEVLELSADLQQGILRGDSADALRKISLSEGFIDMRSMAMQLVSEGVTDEREVHRVLGVVALVD